MQATLTPQPKILTIWRSLLVAATVIPAFLSSLIFRPGAPVWWIASVIWVAAFLFLYLYYFPVRCRKLSLLVDDERFVRTSGVFYHSSRTVPFSNIQFLRVRSSPLHRYFGLASLNIVAPGGELSMPGLKKEEAERLVSVLLSE